jgi:hypothetical protein
MTGDIYRGTLSAKEMSELKTMLASVLTKLDKLDKLEISHKKLENKLETRNRESKERHEALQSKLESSHRELKESNGQLQKNIEIKLEKLQENIKTDLKTETEKLIQRFDLASENQIVEVLNQEKTDVILRRQGERVEQIQLQLNQVSVLDQELKSDVETLNPVENELIDLVDESLVVEFTIPEQTEVILKRQGEHAEHKLIEEICTENSDSGEVKTKEIMAKCKEVSSAPIPYVEKGSVNNPSIKTETVEVKASRVNCLASNAVVSNRVNNSQKVLFLSDENSEMFHSKRLYELLQISTPTKTNASKSEHQCSKRSQRKYRHLHRYNPLYQNFRQNFRGGTYTKKNEGRKQTQGVPSNCRYCR